MKCVIFLHFFSLDINIHFSGLFLFVSQWDGFLCCDYDQFSWQKHLHLSVSYHLYRYVLGGLRRAVKSLHYVRCDRKRKHRTSNKLCKKLAKLSTDVFWVPCFQFFFSPIDVRVFGFSYIDPMSNDTEIHFASWNILQKYEHHSLIVKLDLLHIFEISIGYKFPKVKCCSSPQTKRWSKRHWRNQQLNASTWIIYANL